MKFDKRGEFPSDAPAMLDVALKDANDSWSELRVLVDEKKEEFETYIMNENIHSEIRKLMTTLVPDPLHNEGGCQAAYLRELVSSVRLKCNYNLFNVL